MHAAPALPRILTIAGTDPTGGAGVQADIKSIQAAGGYSYSVVTSLVAQNTTGVQEIFAPPVEFLRAQLRSVADDVEIDAIKIGMLGTTEIIDVVRDFLTAHAQNCRVVLDPVMVASSSDRLLTRDAEAALRELARLADVITPNLPELAVLAGAETATDFDAAIAQAQGLARELGTTVIVKGGHLGGAHADNAVVTAESVHRVPVQRVDTKNTHGTGCSFSSALATRLGAGFDTPAATEWASRWLHEAIAHADALAVGRGHGPVDHGHMNRRMQRAADTRPEHFLLIDAPPTLPLAAPAGPNTQALWDASAPYLTAIMELPFIRALGDGTLRREDFLFYLEQDAYYLVRYARSLHALGGAWAEDANEAIADEQEMQRTWLAGLDRETLPSPITRAYTDFLLASTLGEPAAIGQAAVLPCYWLYYEVGARLAERNHDAHPYRDWLATYAGNEFLASVRGAIDRCERTLADDPDALDAAVRACAVASRYELDFFDQADRAWVIRDV